jgi:hypothetical protein
MLGRWDDRPNDPAYYIEDCRILCIVPLSILQYLYAHSLKSASLRIRYKAYRLQKKVFKRIFYAKIVLEFPR